MRVLALVATFGLARLDLEPHPYLGVLAAWRSSGRSSARARADYDADVELDRERRERRAQSSSEAGAGKL